MFAAIRSLMIDEVQHVLPPQSPVIGRNDQTGTQYGDASPIYDVFGKLIANPTCTTHAARVITLDGKLISTTSRENMADAKAVVWLLNHPRPLAIGESFILATGESLSAVRIEQRSLGADTLSKVYLS